MSTSQVLHPIQVKRALDPAAEHPAWPATVTAVDGDTVSVRSLDGRTASATVADPQRLAETFDRPDVCRLRGEPLALLNTHHGVLALATGPAEAPDQLVVLWVSRIEGGSVVELLGDEGQTSWQIFALTARARST